LPAANAKGHQRRALQANGGLALQVGAAQVGIVGDLGALGVDHEAIGSPQIRQPVHLAVERGVLADEVQKYRLKLFQLELGEIEGLVNPEIALRGLDAILRRLREIVARSAGGTQLRDHFLVVRQGHFHIDARLFLNAAIRSAGT